MITFKTNYNFRAIASTAGNYATQLAEFAANTIAFTTTTEGEGPTLKTSIKRDSFSAELPEISIEAFALVEPNFVQGLINDVVEAAARKKFVDELLPIDLEALTPAFIIESLASQRAAGVSQDQVKAFAKLVVSVLTEAGTKKGTIDIVETMILKKFGKAVLGTYSRFESSFDQLLAKAVMTLEGQSDEVINEHTAVVEMISKNLETFQTAELEDIELDLD